ncbi:hypothetical protein [Enterobacter kobei]|uniref:hypothetical protein n=1 Tax=Enterobacter kobei TaxID=208224 RepID=UPI000643CDBD|nr:hypothetical protein [Enterobacter kobei]EKS6398784.1 hypothetical protein [Enterobacter hormaechei]KLP75332.1 hypothetical protein ABR38_13355 [Enterobacter kobei]
MEKQISKNDYVTWLIQEADKAEKKQIRISFMKMKDVLHAVLVIVTLLASLGAVVYGVQSSL